MNVHGLIPPRCFCALAHAQIASQTKCLSLEDIIILWYHHDDIRHRVCLRDFMIAMTTAEVMQLTLHVFLYFCITFWTFPFYSLHSLSILILFYLWIICRALNWSLSYCSTLTITFLWLPGRTGGRTKTFIHNLMWLLFCFVLFFLCSSFITLFFFYP